MLARPPPAFRTYDERGVEILWLMLIPLYGQQDAGAIWNRTYNEYVTDTKGPLAFERSSNDPCVYCKDVKGGGKVTGVLYVDDGRLLYDADAESAAEGRACAKALVDRFEIKLKDEDLDEDYFLGSNYHQHSRAASTVTAYTYINKMSKQYLDGDCSVSRERPAAWSYTPADETLDRAYAEAVAQRAPASRELTKRYQALFGSLMHAVKCQAFEQHRKTVMNAACKPA